MFAGFNWQQMISAFIVLFAVIGLVFLLENGVHHKGTCPKACCKEQNITHGLVHCRCLL